MLFDWCQKCFKIYFYWWRWEIVCLLVRVFVCMFACFSNSPAQHKQMFWFVETPCTYIFTSCFHKSKLMLHYGDAKPRRTIFKNILYIYLYVTWFDISNWSFIAKLSIARINGLQRWIRFVYNNIMNAVILFFLRSEISRCVFSLNLKKTLR